MRLSVCQVRDIVDEYDYSVDTVAEFYDYNMDNQVTTELYETYVETEEEHLEISLDLYDAYTRAVSSTLINAPALSDLQYAEFGNVLLFASENVLRDDLMYWSERDRFFAMLDDLVIPALTMALAAV